MYLAKQKTIRNIIHLCSSTQDVVRKQIWLAGGNYEQSWATRIIYVKIVGGRCIVTPYLEITNFSLSESRPAALDSPVFSCLSRVVALTIGIPRVSRMMSDWILGKNPSSRILMRGMVTWFTEGLRASSLTIFPTLNLQFRDSEDGEEDGDEVGRTFPHSD